jgi:cell division protein FtsN
MVADFSKKRPQHPKKTHRLQKVLASLLAILVILAIISAYTEYKAHRVKIQQTATKPAIPAKSQAPQFDFYSMLPNMKVAPTSTAPTVNTPQIAISSSPKHYALQVASFKNAAQANTLIAKLTLLGLNPAMQAYQQNHINWSRVVVGPFDSVLKAQKTQHFLNLQHINSLLIKQ